MLGEGTKGSFLSYSSFLCFFDIFLIAGPIGNKEKEYVHVSLNVLFTSIGVINDIK